MSEQLCPEDLNAVVNKLPASVREAWLSEPEGILLAGGFIRALVAREEIQDIDLFVSSKARAEKYLGKLAGEPGPTVLWTESSNAFTIKGLPYVVQVIFNFPFEIKSSLCGAPGLLSGFDFTISQAAVFFSSTWQSLCHSNFYSDLAGKRLHYRPSSNPGGSVARLLKFTRLGYSIDKDSLARLLTRFADECKADEHNPPGEISTAEGPAVSVLNKIRISG